ncbi:ubiquitin carboxyl-terminal hydrolase 20-like isoform X1 [Macrosteles quadrilineatus]|uniref:ubiquitin carboxyl-terminal hydrolase 20-like isoform X1 n=1 Tax=Macrosteles quadrilineatus TaxID=74068 RepID=UPI0023E2ECB3|nr:ubiquitin carboxyl-terminal hydrolase 20-like isoform X1 [Macrosteles quadrilineatus]
MGLMASNYAEVSKDLQQCHSCEVRGANLWLCLYRDCLRVGCGDSGQDHSQSHFQKQPQHCVHLNLSTFRLWCYVCDVEVVIEPPVGPCSSRLRYGDSLDEDSDDNTCATDDNAKPTGLTGLQNIGNTCYMNAALQALSNTPPLTRYFLECGAVVLGGNEAGRKPPNLSRSYLRLMQDMWHRRRLGYVAPNAILYGIRNAHPMFRGYHQHDTQEFLRCFMDQLHEELKVPYIQPPMPHNTRHSFQVRRVSSLDELSEEEGGSGVGMMEGEGGGASSQSEGEEYETCDSGVSERSSLSDEGSTKHAGPLSRSPSPSQDIQMSSLAPHNFHTSHVSPTRGSHRRKQQVKYRSIISDVFDGKLLSSVQCLTCNRISTRMETFQDLSLPIPSKDHLTMLHQGSVNIAKCAELYSTDQGWLSWLWEWVCSLFWGPTVGLHDCLAAFFSADELKGDNMYSCEKCNKLRNGVKFSKVLELPEVLCIHLKRFRHELMFSSKINNYVTFPLEDLDLKPYLHKDCKSKVTTYNLISVICHHGAAGSGGHYTCYSLNEQYNQWYEFDDQCVTLVRPETVRNCEAYVLFYRKASREMSEQRDHILQLYKKTSPMEDMYVVSKAWLTRFYTFTEPGPIDNTDLLCRHNHLLSGRDHYLSTMLTYVPASVWHHLYNIYGGGPTCAKEQLRQCTVCVQETGHRPDIELREFTRLGQVQSTGHYFAIAIGWYSQWENYVKGQTSEAPGPIDNSPLTTYDPSLTLDKDYIHVTVDQWALLHRIYEGGPEVRVQEPQAAPALPANEDPPNTMDRTSTFEETFNMNESIDEECFNISMKINQHPLRKLKKIVARRKRRKYWLNTKRTTLKKQDLRQTGVILKRCRRREAMASDILSHR